MWLIVLLLLGLGLRIGLILAVDFPLHVDSYTYDAVAKSIVAGEGFGNTFSGPPGYSVFLAGLYYLFGNNFLVVRLFQSVLGTLIVLLVYLLAKRLYGLKVGLLAGSIVTIDPFLVYFNAQILSETLFTFLLMLFLYLLIRLLNQSQKSPLAKVIFTGVVLGFAMLTRAVLLGFFVFLILASLITKQLDKMRLKILIIIFFAMTLTMGPWIIRNYRVTKRFVPVSVQMGWNMWEAMNPKPYDVPAYRQWIESMVLETKNMNGLEKDSYFLQKTFNYARKKPKEFLIQKVKNFFRFWRLYPYDPYPKKIKVLSAIFFTPLLVLSLGGIILSSRDSREIFPLLILLLYFSLSSFLFCPAVRYRLHLHPVLGIFAAYSVIKIVERLKEEEYVHIGF